MVLAVSYTHLSATVKPFFGNNSNAPVEGTSNSTGDRHVLVYLEAGGGNDAALYEMWQGIYEGGAWTDSSNALWPDPASNALTPVSYTHLDVYKRQ